MTLCRPGSIFVETALLPPNVTSSINLLADNNEFIKPCNISRPNWYLLLMLLLFMMRMVRRLTIHHKNESTTTNYSARSITGDQHNERYTTKRNCTVSSAIEYKTRNTLFRRQIIERLIETSSSPYKSATTLTLQSKHRKLVITRCRPNGT